jgi:hypothetical protein
MAIGDDQIEAVKRFCATVQTAAVSGLDYVRLTSLRLPGCKPDIVNALLCMGDRGEGYETRLFFSARVEPAHVCNLNWNANGVRILEENWHAFSWKVPKGMSVVDTLIEHLKPLR